MDYIDEHLLLCSEAYEQEKIRWNYTNQATLDERIENLKSSLLANIEWFNSHLPVGSSIDYVSLDNKEVVKVEYFNIAGMCNLQPWNGVNIKVTTYHDGSTSTEKVIVR